MRNLPTAKGPFINFGSGGAGGKLGGALKKNHNKEGGLPKLFCLVRGGGGLKKINLFYQIILVKETNIVEYLVLM